MFQGIRSGPVYIYIYLYMYMFLFIVETNLLLIYLFIIYSFIYLACIYLSSRYLFIYLFIYLFKTYTCVYMCKYHLYMDAMGYTFTTLPLNPPHCQIKFKLTQLQSHDPLFHAKKKVPSTSQTFHLLLPPTLFLVHFVHNTKWFPRCHPTPTPEGG